MNLVAKSEGFTQAQAAGLLLEVRQHGRVGLNAQLMDIGRVIGQVWPGSRPNFQDVAPQAAEQPALAVGHHGIIRPIRRTSLEHISCRKILPGQCPEDHIP